MESLLYFLRSLETIYDRFSEVTIILTFTYDYNSTFMIMTTKYS